MIGAAAEGEERRERETVGSAETPHQPLSAVNVWLQCLEERAQLAAAQLAARRYMLPLGAAGKLVCRPPRLGAQALVRVHLLSERLSEHLCVALRERSGRLVCQTPERHCRLFWHPPL